ncbi:glutamine-hydrolyzing carbamoyl-phosphate synthase small subunit [Sulfurospirillum sp. 1612]|uniref:glutamine-hydrolyzing carbamoyl-phosphate synthase small subunit n=1 Tax=Sulfurospirillum sp. 1612 TaxID=3094835 RepID=UPI002F92EDA2
MKLKPIWIYLENGIFLEAKSFGSDGTRVGEIVFNTSMSGYEEIMSDPSYAGQFVVFTMPEIGIVGINKDDMESDRVHASGMIVRNFNEYYSNFRAEDSIDHLLIDNNAIGICDIDTRYLTTNIRDHGSKMMIASTEISNKEELKEILHSFPRIEEVNFIKEVSTKEPYIHKSGSWDGTQFKYHDAPKGAKKKVVVLDYGVKRNILNELCMAGLEVEVVPHDSDIEVLIQRYRKGEINALFLSNGPGDPMFYKEEVAKIKTLIEAKVPMFAICLGHQLLSIAHGYPTYKLLFGQHGGNHPVRYERNRVVEITAQNHNYNVPASICEIAEVTHKNLFDNTIEGVAYKNEPIFSVQHHPEASPGPHDSKYIFKEFAQKI